MQFSVRRRTTWYALAWGCKCWTTKPWDNMMLRVVQGCKIIFLSGPIMHDYWLSSLVLNRTSLKKGNLGTVLLPSSHGIIHSLISMYIYGGPDDLRSDLGGQFRSLWPNIQLQCSNSQIRFLWTIFTPEAHTWKSRFLGLKSGYTINELFLPLRPSSLRNHSATRVLVVLGWQSSRCVHDVHVWNRERRSFHLFKIREKLWKFG